MNWNQTYAEKLGTLEDAATFVKSGDRIAVGAISGVPVELINAVTARPDLDDILFLSGLWVGLPDFAVNDLGQRFRYAPIFMGPVERMLMDRGIIDPISVHFSQGGALIESAAIDVALLEVSPPDADGRMSIGPGSSLLGAALFASASRILVQVNPAVPNLCGGDVHIHVDQVDCICEISRPMPELPPFVPDEVEKEIAALITEQIPDGATLQLGIGKLANAIGTELLVKKDIGIHSELLTPSMIELAKKGVITGARKTLHPGKIIVAFSVGGKEDYEYIHENESVEFHPASYVNNTAVIAQNNDFISVNNALAVDLSGQVSSESIGAKQFSATGGQVDFVRGAGLAPGGKSFIALKSTGKTAEGRFSRIRATFAPGTIVTTPRSDVQYVATEFGIADLRMKSIPAKVNEMLRIAHPDFRDELAKEAVDLGLVHVSHLHQK